MKKILALLAAGVFTMSLSSCDNKTKEKVVTGGVITADTATGGVGATTVASAQTVSGSVSGLSSTLNMVTGSLSNINAKSAPRRLGVMAIQKSYGYTADADGWFKYEYSGTGYSYLYKYRLLNGSGAPITGSTEDDIWGTLSNVKSYEYDYSGYYDLSLIGSQSTQSEDNYANPAKKYTYDGYMKWTYNVAGDYSGGGREDGSYTYKVVYNDGTEQSFSSTVEGLTIEYLTSSPYYRITAGTIRVSYYGWRIVVTYASDGSATGTITGPGYSATIAITASGTITYTDSTGTHSAAPVKG